MHSYLVLCDERGATYELQQEGSGVEVRTLTSKGHVSMVST